MRAFVLVVIAVLVAGCASKDDASRTPEAPAEPPSDVEETSRDERPSVDVEIVHAFTEEDETQTFDIPPGAGRLSYAVGFDGDTVCIGATSRIVVKSPSGEVEDDLEGSNVQVGGGRCSGSQTMDDGVFLEPGTWTVEFTGRATHEGYVRVATT